MGVDTNLSVHEAMLGDSTTKSSAQATPPRTVERLCGRVEARRLSVLRGHCAPVAVAQGMLPLGARPAPQEVALHGRISRAFRAEGTNATCPEGHPLAVASAAKPTRCRNCGARVVGAYVTCSRGHLQACGKCALRAAGGI